MTILYILIGLFIVGIWIYSVYDLIKRLSKKQISGLNFALWLLAIIIFPVVGSLVYAIIRPAAPLEETT